MTFLARTTSPLPARFLRTLTGVCLPLLAAWSLTGCETPDRSRGALHPDHRPSQEMQDPGEEGAEGAATSLLDVRAQPATFGLDSLLLTRAVDRASQQTRLHNMLVVRHGEVALERHFRGPSPGQPANVKSVSKSILSALVGLAIHHGHLEGIDATIAPFFPDYLPPEAQGESPEDGPADGDEDLRSRITMEHLLSMSSGLETTSNRNYGRWVASSNWVRYALTRPMGFAAGTRRSYSTGNTHLASAVLTRATGQSTHAFAREALAEPLSIDLPRWPQDPQGVYFGGNDMLVSPRDLARFGELFRRGGTLDSVELLSREWIEESWAIRTRAQRSGNGYGLAWWARQSGGHEIRFAWGYGGQFLFVVPALELTVVFTSDPWSPREGNHNQVLHRILDDFLIPAAERGSEGSAPATGTDETH